MNGVNFGLVETAVAKHGCLQKKVRSILAALPISIIYKSPTWCCYFLNNPQFVLAHHQ